MGKSRQTSWTGGHCRLDWTSQKLVFLLPECNKTCSFQLVYTVKRTKRQKPPRQQKKKLCHFENNAIESNWHSTANFCQHKQLDNGQGYAKKKRIVKSPKKGGCKKKKLFWQTCLRLAGKPVWGAFIIFFTSVRKKGGNIFFPRRGVYLLSEFRVTDCRELFKGITRKRVFFAARQKI